MEQNLEETYLAAVGPYGHIALSPQVSRIMDWEPGMEIMGTKVDGMLILQPFQPRCCICGSVLHVKEVGNLFLCQKCIQRADQAPCYSGMDAARENTPFPEEYEEDLEDACAEECGALQDCGYPNENDEDYDSDIFMRNHK
ncbi:MAG: hypothetical protein HFE66_06865 [Clostridiales bacterium]|jgi:hypothetical protein|nr:hypothetical protein [Clostridiales bacterium]